MITKFKVGDTVKCIDDHCVRDSIQKGRTYIIEKVNFSVDPPMVSLCGLLPLFREDRFSLVMSTKFKAGDKVKCINGQSYYKPSRYNKVPKTGNIYEIREILSSGNILLVGIELKIEYDFDTGFSCERFVLVNKKQKDIVNKKKQNRDDSNCSIKGIKKNPIKKKSHTTTPKVTIVINLIKPISPMDDTHTLIQQLRVIVSDWRRDAEKSRQQCRFQELAYRRDKADKHYQRNLDFDYCAKIIEDLLNDDPTKK